MEVIHVVTALILDERHRILVQQRGPNHPYPGYWETPGGKIEKGEEPVDALRRELSEELGLKNIHITPRPLITIGYSPPVGIGEYDVSLYRVIIPPDASPKAMEEQLCVKYCSLLKMDRPRVPSLETMIAALDTVYPLLHEL